MDIDAVLADAVTRVRDQVPAVANDARKHVGQAAYVRGLLERRSG